MSSADHVERRAAQTGRHTCACKLTLSRRIFLRSFSIWTDRSYARISVDSLSSLAIKARSRNDANRVCRLFRFSSSTRWCAALDLLDSFKPMFSSCSIMSCVVSCSRSFCASSSIFSISAASCAYATFRPSNCTSRAPTFDESLRFFNAELRAISCRTRLTSCSNAKLAEANLALSFFSASSFNCRTSRSLFICEFCRSASPSCFRRS